VELWSSLGPVAVAEPDDWTVAIDHASAPAVRLAETIAGTVASWIGNGEMLEGQGRPVRPGDIMVLVRKRDSFVHALSRALKNRGVPVAGADRLLLTDHIAVKDLVAIGRFALQPHDDLSLAALLRSPIFGLSDEQLFELARDRGKTSLFSAMQEKAEEDVGIGRIVETLDDWRDQAGFRPSFEFYAGILAGTPEREGARKRLIARLGPEAGDIIDEFMSFCLTLEQTGGDGLESLIATLDTAAPEIKREMDQRRDEVRILTVHAAKGLEAPVVFLVDSGGRPFVEQHLPRLLPFRSKTGAWEGEGFLWRAGADLANSESRAISAEIGRKAEEEYRRLLYVGMTRAEDRLIVCGYHGVLGKPGNSWHSMVEAGLASAATETLEQPAECQPVRRYRVSDATPVEPGQVVGAAAAPLPPLPDAFSQPLPPVPPLPRPLKPSGASLAVETSPESTIGRRSPVLEPEDADSPARAWGTALHRLLQVLPDLPEEAREPAAMRYLAGFGARWPEAERERAWKAVSAILSDAGFGALFAEGSRAEVSVMGTLDLGGRARAISGKIDRLAVSADEVLIIDYKTNRGVPKEISEVPPEHVAQLALYRALLQPVYPGRRISAALLYTAAPVLMPVPVGALEDALARLTRS
jgi:ATP-dependent helicase/nuclease subunit A